MAALTASFLFVKDSPSVQLRLITRLFSRISCLHRLTTLPQLSNKMKVYIYTAISIYNSKLLLWCLRITRLTLNCWFEYLLIFWWLNADSDKGTHYCLFLEFFRSASRKENFRISRTLKVCLAVYFRNFAVLNILRIFYFLGTFNASVGFFKMFCKLHSRVSRYRF